MPQTQRRILPSVSALAAFDAVARHRSFSLAASELSLTQGAISRQIAVLEAQLGTILFDRTGRGVTLTGQGETYHRSISEALGLIRNASLQIMTKMHDNALNLAILPTFGTRWLMPRIPRFVAQHPEITLNFATRIGRFDFEAEGLDAAIHVGQPDWPGAQASFLMGETVAPVASPAFLANNPVIKPSDLLALPLLDMASRPGAWQDWFTSLGLNGRSGRTMRFEQFSNVAQAAIAGLGVALMPVFLIGSELETGQLVPAYDHAIKSRSSYWLVTPTSRRDHQPVKLFLDWLLSEIADAQAGSPDQPPPSARHSAT